MSTRMDNLLPPGSLFKRPRPKRAKADLGRAPREHDPQHLAAIRKLPCLACVVQGLPLSSRDSEAAHVQTGSAAHGKRSSSMSMKADDKWTWPACKKHHAEQHRIGELQFWYDLELSPFKICEDLYAASPDVEKMRAVIMDLRSGEPLRRRP